MDRLTADDLVMLWTDQRWPLDIGLVAVAEGGDLLDGDGDLRLGAIRAALGDRVARVPRFRQRLVTPRWGLGRPYWADDPGFDIELHVRSRPVAAPGDDRALLATVETIRRKRLDRTRPLWELWLLPGLTAGRVGLFVRAHHVMGGGIPGMAMLAALLDATPDATVPHHPAWTPAPEPTRRSLWGDALAGRVHSVRRLFDRLAHPVREATRLRAMWPALQETLAAAPSPPTSLGRRVGDERAFAVVRTSLDDMASAAHSHGATINDVLLTVVAGGLRALLAHRGEPVTGLSVPAFVPATLRASRGQAGANMLQWILTPLPLEEPDPLRRLMRIRSETAGRRDRPGPPWARLLANRVIRWLFLRLTSDRRDAAVYVTNVPGPPVPLYLAGATLLEVVPIVPLIETGPGIGALSYAGQFVITVVTDPATCPDAQVIVDGLQQDLQAILACQVMPGARHLSVT